MLGDHHFSINGVKWLWRYTVLRGAAIGWTYMPDPKNLHVKKKVLIDGRLKGRARLNTEIHEFLHAANPTHSEDHVTQQADDLTRILWVLGYRLREDQ
jgi:hypothetical protein